MADAPTKVPCPLCGTQIATGLYRCPQCTGELRPTGAPEREGLTAYGVFGAVALAIVVVIAGLWVVYDFTTANDGLECSIENVERAQEGRPTLECPD
ncbi:hypothetical protein GCM10009737_08590 [Nocardioides lentus]|uniref:Zinc ribbon domain-containing protein n=1 Tax=Nocardioides lentus TaxID=338077 RepID=A0ABP5ACX7_9ACTN